MQEDNNKLSNPEKQNLSEMESSNVTVEALPSLVDSYKELTLQMAFYFDSLKSVDKFFDKAAQRFYAETEKFSVKKNPTNEEVAEMMKNLAYAAATRGVGAIYKAYKTGQALATIKELLKEEGERRLPALYQLQSQLQKSIEKASGKLINALNYTSNSLEGVEKPFNRLRSLLFLDHQAQYLIATYEEAAQGNLQDRVAFPSMYHINSYLLYNYIMPVKGSNSPQGQEAARKEAVERLIASIEENLSGRFQIKPRDLIFAADAGLMAVAISDLVPSASREGDEEGFSPINEETMIPESTKDYMKLFHIASLAESRPESPLSKALFSNSTFMDFIRRVIDMNQVAVLYKKKENIYLVNCFLIGVLGFLASMERLNLRWYWSLLIGIGTFVIACQATPFSKLKYLVKKKITYIDNKIFLTSLESAGYSEHVSLKEIEKAANRIFWFAICGAVLGFCFIPFPGGLIIGALIGAFFGNSKDEGSNPNFNYELINIGSWKSITLMVILIAGILAYLYFFFM